MNITPWVQSLIRANPPVEQDWQIIFDCTVGGYGIQVKCDEWFGYRELQRLLICAHGLAMATAKTLGGERCVEYAWDETDVWNYEKGAAGYYFNCNLFEISCLKDSACMEWYNFCVDLSCIAHAATKGSFPRLCKGANLGFMDPAKRKNYDLNGFPNEAFMQQIRGLRY